MTKKEKLAQLERILKSRLFQDSVSLKSFLRFVVMKTIQGESAGLKEYVIATEVFGRSSDYDPKSDSVVRVQAGRLRGKLRDYYLTEGGADPITLEMPKGRYIPTFSRREPSLAPSPEVDAAEPNFGGGGRLSEDARSRHWRERALVWPFWRDFLDSSDPCWLVFSNTLFEGTAETGMKLFKPLDAPGSNPGSPAVTRIAAGAFHGPRSIVDHYTGVGETMGVYLLSEFFGRVDHPFRVKRSLLLTWEDLKSQHIVVLGSPAENFFLRDLPQKQVFIFQPLRDEQGRETFGIVNLDPRPGEAACYFARQEGPSRSQVTRDYAVISLLTGLGAKKKIMVLAGITTYGTQAAAEYVTKPGYLEELIGALQLRSESASPHLSSGYQILIEVKVNDGVPIQVQYLTHHSL